MRNLEQRYHGQAWCEEDCEPDYDNEMLELESLEVLVADAQSIEATQAEEVFGIVDGDIDVNYGDWPFRPTIGASR